MSGLRRLWSVPAARPAQPVDPAAVRALSARLEASAVRRLGRSLSVRHVGAGGCNGCELELRALHGLVHDLARFGLQFATSPRHADVLLVTGPVTRNMQEALLHTWHAMADPKWVVAVGDCAIDGGVFKGGYAVSGGAADHVPVDIIVRGCPPTPDQVLAALRTLIEAQG